MCSFAPSAIDSSRASRSPVTPAIPNRDASGAATTDPTKVRRDIPPDIGVGSTEAVGDE
jgi:hypothetical protein